MKPIPKEVWEKKLADFDNGTEKKTYSAYYLYCLSDHCGYAGLEEEFEYDAGEVENGEACPHCDYMGVGILDDVSNGKKYREYLVKKIKESN